MTYAVDIDALRFCPLEGFKSERVETKEFRFRWMANLYFVAIATAPRMGCILVASEPYKVTQYRSPGHISMPEKTDPIGWARGEYD